MLFFLLACACEPIKATKTSPQIAKTSQSVVPSKEAVPSEPTMGTRSFSIYFAHPDQGMVAVVRKGPKNNIEQFALDSLYAGPQKEEKEKGLTLISCKSTGAKIISINQGLATIQLQGDCGDCGSIGIYDSITKTAKQFSNIQYVHLLDPKGKTQKLSSQQDARPACLAP